MSYEYKFYMIINEKSYTEAFSAAVVCAKNKEDALRIFLDSTYAKIANKHILRFDPKNLIVREIELVPGIVLISESS